MQIEYRIVVTSNAANGLANIVDYIEGAFSVEVSDKFLNHFDEILLLIKTRPMMFPFSKTSNKVSRALVNRLTSIYFSTDENVITILAIEDNRKQQPKF